MVNSQAPQKPKLKVLYFDIDGTFLDYDDAPKVALINGLLEFILKKADFDFIACVSGWVDIFAAKVMELNSLQERKEAMYRKLQPLFTLAIESTGDYWQNLPAQLLKDGIDLSTTT